MNEANNINVESGGKMQKTNAALGGKMQKTPFSSEKTTFFTLGKDEAIAYFESVSNAADWFTIIPRMVRESNEW